MFSKVFSSLLMAAVFFSIVDVNAEMGPIVNERDESNAQIRRTLTPPLPTGMTLREPLQRQTLVPDDVDDLEDDELGNFPNPQPQLRGDSSDEFVCSMFFFCYLAFDPFSVVFETKRQDRLFPGFRLLPYSEYGLSLQTKMIGSHAKRWYSNVSYDHLAYMTFELITFIHVMLLAIHEINY